MKNLNTKLLLSSTILLILLLLVTVYWGNVKNRYFELTGIENSAEATKLVVGTNLWMVTRPPKSSPNVKLIKTIC